MCTLETIVLCIDCPITWAGTPIMAGDSTWPNSCVYVVECRGVGETRPPIFHSPKSSVVPCKWFSEIEIVLYIDRETKSGHYWTWKPAILVCTTGSQGSNISFSYESESPLSYRVALMTPFISEWTILLRLRDFLRIGKLHGGEGED